jgi:two-component system LytT family sensor kinase
MHVAVLHWYGFGFRSALIDSAVSNGMLCIFCVLISNTFRYYLPQRARYSYFLVFGIIMTLCWLLISRSILMLLSNRNKEYNHFFSQSLPVRCAIAFLIIGSMILLSVLWYTLQDRRDNEKRKSEAEKLAKESELYKLRQQLQPHFLFNSLNSINALIGFKPDAARHMIQQLSDFLRGTLKKENNQWTTLEEELNHLQLYLDIEKVRFGHRLQTVIEKDESTNQMKVPAMVLQPIVENAIKFGLYDTTGDITITIRVTIETDNLMIQVTNPYDSATSGPHKGTGFGISSVQRRLYLIFAQHGLLQTSANNSLFTTTITIPQQV